MSKKHSSSNPSNICCSIRRLPPHLLIDAALRAIDINPVNGPATIHPQRIAIETTKYWGSSGVHLTVGFLSNISNDLRAKIISHMNAWSQYANVKFTDTGSSEGQVRIAFANDGYWSYLGPDILSIPAGQPTINLEGFDKNNNPDSEYHRVVRHETAHTLGCPHEHIRQALVKRLDPVKTKSYFLINDGWDEQTVIQQVLTPLEESALIVSGLADQDSIMCYQLPGSITIDGQPIRGGTDIDPADGTFIGKVYPLSITPTPTPTPTGTPAFTLTFQSPVQKGQDWHNVAKQYIAPKKYNCFAAQNDNEPGSNEIVVEAE